jgi:putative MATE family efflux protein
MTDIEKTKNIDILMGNPEKAVITFAIPMIVSMLVQESYFTIDMIWVAGLGSSTISAVGFAAPLLFIWIGINTGFSAGATAVVSRFIGAGDKVLADKAASNVLVIGFILSIILTVSGFITFKPILIFLGAGNVLDLSCAFWLPFVIGSIIMVFMNIAYGILRAEGSIKKITYAMIASSIINIILDPILIYKCHFGVMGGSLGTIISYIIVCFVLIYWFKRDTYLKLSFNKFSFHKDIVKKLLLVAVPGAMEFFIISILFASLNMVLLNVTGDIGVATYSSGWQLIWFFIFPFTAISMGALPVIGANLGKKNYKNIVIVRNFTIKIEFLIAFILAFIMFFFANYIAVIFSYNSPELYDHLVIFLKFMVFFILVTPIGSVMQSFFQGLGRGSDALIITFCRELLLIVIIAHILTSYLHLGENGVWLAIVVGNVFGCLFSYIYSNYYISKHLT